MFRLGSILLILGLLVTGLAPASACSEDEADKETVEVNHIVSNTNIEGSEKGGNITCHASHCCISCRIIPMNLGEQYKVIQSPAFYTTYHVFNMKFGRNFNSAAWHPPKVHA